ncbi:response regulator [Dietzia sp. NPDC055340]
MRSGFSMMLSAEDDIEVVGDAADGAAAIEACRRLRPDVVLMDVQMPGMDGIEATNRIVDEGLSSVLILTTFDRDDYLFDALRAGAGGFLLKNSDPDDLVDGIRAVAHGHALLAPEVTRRVIEKMTTPPDAAERGAVTNGAGSAGPAGAAGSGGGTDDVVVGSSSPAGGGGTSPALDALTAREREVLRHVARGLSNAEIAAELVVGEATVKSHVSACLSKLHLRDRVQAVVLAYEAGLVRPGD